MLPGRGLEMRKAGYSRRTALIAVGGIAAVLIIVLYFATASPAAEQVPDPAVSSSIPRAGMTSAKSKSTCKIEANAVRLNSPLQQTRFEGPLDLRMQRQREQ